MAGDCAGTGVALLVGRRRIEIAENAAEALERDRVQRLLAEQYQQMVVPKG